MKKHDWAADVKLAVPNGGGQPNCGFKKRRAAAPIFAAISVWGSAEKQLILFLLCGDCAPSFLSDGGFNVALFFALHGGTR